MKISVIGLGKLGSPMCAVFAAAGHMLIGVDLDASKCDTVNSGHAPVGEPGLEELISSLPPNRLSATTDTGSAIINTDMTFIIVATPSQEDGKFSLKYVLPVCESIGAAISQKSTYHTIILTSTVMPGQTAEVTAALEHASGKKHGVDFGVAYNPEFIALGSVIHDLHNPDLLLIGTDDSRVGDTLKTFYGTFVNSFPIIALMKPVEAELTKIAVNTFVTTKIAYANMLADFCDKLSGANVDVVAAAIGADSRIGVKYLKGGVAFGGPCFPRDNVALKALGESLGVDVSVPREVHNSNIHRVDSLVKRVMSRALGRRVAIIGLTYKIGSEVIEESAGWKMMLALHEKYVDLYVYDPLFSSPILRGVKRMTDLRQCIEETDLVIVMLPYPEVIALEPTAWARTAEQRRDGSGTDRIVVDCWRVLPNLAECNGIKYWPLGVGEDK